MAANPHENVEKILLPQFTSGKKKKCTYGKTMWMDEGMEVNYTGELVNWKRVYNTKSLFTIVIKQQERSWIMKEGLETVWFVINKLFKVLGIWTEEDLEKSKQGRMRSTVGMVKNEEKMPIGREEKDMGCML